MLTPAPLSPLASLPAAKLPTALANKPAAETSNRGAVKDALELKEAFQQFVGETFFGQLMKSMRQTVGEPAYLHGGMAEEQFQARLDQQIAQDMASRGTDGLADSLFANQFPDQAALLAETATDPAPKSTSSLEALDALRRR